MTEVVRIATCERLRGAERLVHMSSTCCATPELQDGIELSAPETGGFALGIICRSSEWMGFAGL